MLWEFKVICRYIFEFMLDSIIFISLMHDIIEWIEYIYKEIDVIDNK